jgi:hypothetical protein
MPTTPPPRTAPSGVHRPAAELLAEENQQLRDELRRQRVAVVPPEPISRRVGRALTDTKAGQWGTLAGAIAIVVTAVSPIIGSWMDVQRLRAELVAETAARQALELRLGTVVAETDSRIRTLDTRANALDAWRTQELEREPKREEAICRAGQQVPWRVDLTCRKR